MKGWKVKFKALVEYRKPRVELSGVIISEPMLTAEGEAFVVIRNGNKLFNIDVYFIELIEEE